MLSRNYDKGERRFKHVGKRDEPYIEMDDGNPKKWVGKCPANLNQEDRTKLLNEAIGIHNVDSDLPVPHRLYVVHKGAIYEAQTSDWGRTYHGYPYKGGLSRAILGRLEEMAKEKGCLEDFNEWVKRHIKPHGFSR